MTYINTGLTNGGLTASGHYQIEYDDALSKADGLDRASGLYDKCEEDFALMKTWFKGIDPAFGFPMRVQITNSPPNACSSAKASTPAPIDLVASGTDLTFGALLPD
jgi:hypothetical protein